MNNGVIEKLYSFLKKEYEDDNDYKFSHNFKESGFSEYDIEDILEIYGDRAVAWLKLQVNLCLYSFDRFIYTFFDNKNALDQTLELQRASTYAYSSLLLAAKSCKCYRGDSEINMLKVGFLFSLVLLVKEEKESTEIGNYLLASLDAKNCVIKRGDAKALSSWFVIELYALATNQEINKKKARYPQDFSVYGDILPFWDSDDLDVIDTMVSALCNEHTKLSIIPLNSENEEERKETLQVPAFEIFPYEALVWLKLRERAGLKNPKTFSHPLMNTPIAKMFLDIKEPLPKPTELPYAKELLEKLKEQCPDVEIPEWLEEITNRHTIPEDFMK